MDWVRPSKGYWILKAIEFVNLSYHYPDAVKALDSLSAEIEDGDCVAVVGSNGAGKTTLLNILAGFIRPTEGAFRLYGKTIGRGDEILLRKTIGFSFQNPDDQLFMPTVIEDVCFGPLSAGENPEAVHLRALSLLEDFGIKHLGKRFPGHLSGGEKRLVALAGVLIMKPKIIAMDEPTAFLDPCARGHFLEVIKGLPHTRLFITHDMNAVTSCASKALILNCGRLTEQGDPRQLFVDKDLMKRNRLMYCSNI